MLGKNPDIENKILEVLNQNKNSSNLPIVVMDSLKDLKGIDKEFFCSFATFFRLRSPFISWGISEFRLKVEEVKYKFVFVEEGLRNIGKWQSGEFDDSIEIKM